MCDHIGDQEYHRFRIYHDRGLCPQAHTPKQLRCGIIRNVLIRKCTYRTEMCWGAPMGVCSKGDYCPHAHTPEERARWLARFHGIIDTGSDLSLWFVKFDPEVLRQTNFPMDPAGAHGVRELELFWYNWFLYPDRASRGIS